MLRFVNNLNNNGSEQPCILEIHIPICLTGSIRQSLIVSFLLSLTDIQ